MPSIGTAKNIAEFLMHAGTAIANARETPDILAALEVYGYDDEVLQQGQNLLDTARTLTDAQRKEHGDQYAATAARKDALAKADEIYTAHRQLAAIVFKGDADLRAALALDERKKKSFSGWFDQATRFYNNLLANADAVTDMGRFRMTQEKLAEGQTLVKLVGTLDRVQDREMGEAQRATQARDAAIDELNEWMSEFKTVAKIALAGDPQMLEALGFGVIP